MTANPNIERLREYLDATSMGDWSLKMETSARSALDALAAELDAARAELDQTGEYLLTMTRRAVAAEAALEAAQAALREYGEHDARCDYLRRNLPCNCGFVAALAAPADTEPPNLDEFYPEDGQVPPWQTKTADTEGGGRG